MSDDLEGFINGRMYKAPHCDDLVLHAPGKCKYCDKYPRRQAARVEGCVNFTGENRPGFSPCPSTLRRSLNTIEKWFGNRAYPATEN